MAQDSVRYICPVCDHEIAAGSHFCWNCKKIVRNPWRYTGGHLPNENHEGCHPMASFMRPREKGVERTAFLKNSSNMPKQIYTQKAAARRSAAGGPIYRGDSSRRSPDQQGRVDSQKGTYQDSLAKKTGGARQNRNTGASILFATVVIFWLIIWMFASWMAA